MEADIDFAEVDEPIITIKMTVSQAKDIQASLSDLLCWLSGYNACLSLSDKTEHSPMGVEGARALNIAIKRELRLYP